MTYLDLKLGYGCNNNCLHCVIADQRDTCRSKGVDTDRSTEECKKELVDSKSRGATEVTFTGGEPTIREDIFELIYFAKNLGYSINMQTNGRMFYYEEFTKAISKNLIRSFVIALHGPNEKTHDKITEAKGSFKQTVEGIKNLISLKQTVRGKMVLSKINYRQLKETITLMIELGIKSIFVAFPHAQGNARKNFDVIVPKYSEIINYVKDSIKFCKKKGIEIYFEAIPFCFMTGYEDHVSELRDIGINYKELKQLGENKKNWAEIRKKIKRKFPQCSFCDYTQLCEGPWMEYPAAFGNKEFRPVYNKKIDEIKIELTYGCNSHCYFCQNKTIPTEKKQLTTKQILNLLDDIKRNDIKKVRFTGGEPTLRKDLLEILAYAKKLGLIVKLNTNGRFNIDYAKKLSNHIDVILFSVHGDNKKSNKQITKTQDFDNKIKIIKFFSRSKVHTACNTIMNKETVKNLNNFLRLMDKLKVQDWFFSPQVPVPGEKNYYLKNKEIELIVEKLIKYNKKQKTTYSIGKCATIPFCSCDPRKILDLYSGKEAGGKFCGPNNSLVVSPKGDVRFCYSINKMLGNTLKNSLKDILGKKLLNKNLSPAECKGCLMEFICRGGCRFTAESINGNLTSSHPLSQKERYKDLLFQ